MNYNQIGHESLEAFVSTTQKVVEENQFDYLMAASDSGQLAAHITYEVYDVLNLPPPPMFIAPIFRHVDKKRTIPFDNTVQASKFGEWNDRAFNRTLFVDDEIWHGNTLRGILDLVMSLNVRIESLDIVAEDGGFNHQDIPYEMPITFTPSKQRVREIYNAFSYTIPEQFFAPVYEALGDTALNHKQIMCTLLDLPVKSRPDGMPCFSRDLLGVAEEGLTDFKDYQMGYRNWLRRTIKGYMN